MERNWSSVDLFVSFCIHKIKKHTYIEINLHAQLLGLFWLLIAFQIKRCRFCDVWSHVLPPPLSPPISYTTVQRASFLCLIDLISRVIWDLAKCITQRNKTIKHFGLKSMLYCCARFDELFSVLLCIQPAHIVVHC